MRKVAARWVLRLLSDEDKKKRMGAALEFLLEYNELGDEILDRIAKGDVSWVHFWTLSPKRNRNNGRKKKNRHRKNANRFPAQER